ncbi:uncharacterized protein LOC117822274 isoform X2 [Notolabrus celidotus]|uniref:uncharacterized protein LOC117822274 isoform X2 n=1 Tax=Notolabrus celidotus TaxID=1203425 RepID=UPI00148F54CD|nr:uncharacterized protein LOC117822274 isoform X2 [Notolabrus celidotus]
MALSHPQGLLTLVLCVVISHGRADPQEYDTVTATQQENVTLPCSVSNLMDPKSCYRIKWTKDASKKVILARPETSKIQDAARVKWQANEQGHMCLFITKVQKSDEGMYSCEICKGWDCTLDKNIYLKVKECKALQPVNVKPSTRASLHCEVDVTSGQQGPQNISWEKLKGGHSVSVSRPAESNETSLVIQSVSQSDSGWYRCKYMLGQTERCFEIKLQVGNVEVTTSMTTSMTTAVPALTTSLIILETMKEGSSGALIAVIVTVAIVGIAITTALTLLIIYNRRNTQEALQHTQSPHTGDAVELYAEYEVTSLTPSNDLLTQRVNTLYKYQDDNIDTFHY